MAISGVLPRSLLVGQYAFDDSQTRGLEPCCIQCPTREYGGVWSPACRHVLEAHFLLNKKRQKPRKRPEPSILARELVNPFHLEVTPVKHVALLLNSHSCPPSDLAERTTALELARSFLRSGSSERYSAHYRNHFSSNTDVSTDGPRWRK